MRYFSNLFLLSLFLTTKVSAADVFTSFVQNINPDHHYVFYSHGYIVEGDNPKPISSRWGTYDFPAVKQALSDDDYQLIAYHRPAKTDPVIFAKKLAADVKKLIDKGVKPEHISLLGFSRGGAISILTSTELKMAKVNTIILAGCGGHMKRNTAQQVYGNIYSIYETSDGVGSCQFLIDRSSNVSAFSEIAISTGKGHGAFYNPLPVWVAPVKQWIKSQKN
jgi:predicted esterase